MVNSHINTIGKIYTRPWGTYQTLDMGQEYQVKLIIVKPNSQLSLQKHLKRSEHWVVIQGEPTMTVGDRTRIYAVNESVFIPRETIHRIKNLTDQPAMVIEVQIGSYLGEDDIIRLEDIYGRQLT